MLPNVAAISKGICIDTDSMKSNQENNRGYVSTLEGISWDECNGNILIERFCNNGKPDYREVNCEKGCNRGACSKYSLFKPNGFRLPLAAKFESILGIATPAKKISDYEMGKLDLEKLNKNLIDIDKRLSLIEISLPESNIFPVVLDASGNKLKAVNSDNKVMLIKATAMIAEASTDAELEEGKISIDEFYKAISSSSTKAITKRGKALILAADSWKKNGA